MPAPRDFEELIVTVEPGFLRVVVRGEYRFANAMSLIERAATESQRNGLDRILVDISGVRLDTNAAPTVAEQYETGTVIARRVGAKIAVLASERALIARDFVDTVAQNRGAFINTFTDGDAALSWLLAD